MRYVVTELEGYANPDHTARAGLSVQVLDTLVCHRVVKSWRSEDYRNRNGNSQEWARKKGREHAAAMNEGKAPPRDKGFRATCPLCRRRLQPNETTCSHCGGASVFAPPTRSLPRCGYCDTFTRSGKRVCEAHSDLPALEPLDDRYLLTEDEQRG